MSSSELVNQEGADRTMRVQTRVLVVFFSLAVVAGAATASSGLWLHVKVDEGEGAKVTVNLPLALVERAIPLLPRHEIHEAHIGLDHADLEIEELRGLWQEIQASPDMTFMTVEEDDENVRVWKESGWVYVQVQEAEGAERVDVKVPVQVVDALLSGEELDIAAAVRALVEHGEGDFVTVRDHDDNVRVWIDDVPDAE
jgi:hypothetical protein